MKTKRNKQTRKSNVYTKKDFESGDGMLTSVWGPSMWHYLHTMSFNYPVHPSSEERKHYHSFMKSLVNVLPCKYCRINLKTNYKNLPLRKCDMKNRESFSKYVYHLHELVNKMLKKKSGLSYCQVRDRYENFRARCTQKKPLLFKVNKRGTQKEKGCTIPLYGKKAKGIIKIVPQESRCKSFQMNKQCEKKLV
jgi:hypothetical protein